MNEKQQQYDLGSHKLEIVINDLKDFMDNHKHLMHNHNIQKFNIFRDLLMEVKAEFDQKQEYLSEEEQIEQEIRFLIDNGYTKEQIDKIVANAYRS